MRDQIIEILEDINPEPDYDTCTTLIDDRYLESLSMVSLVAELEDEFDITIPAVEVVAENFNSADAITKLVERLVEEEED
jgi:acyl carrier protein